ncbi:MAG TPA: hypothetical protein VG795_01500 [Acidimicrobiia bacterium]|nr:hypothetical protein [Acidimicrobiia bacterium]
MSETIRILPLLDPVIETLGHDPRAPYFERFWLPTLGPTAFLLVRHIAHRFDRAPDGFTLDLGETSRCLGLGERYGRNSPLARSLGRIVQFDLAVQEDGETLAVRRHIPPINRRHVRRLPPSAQKEHDAWVRSHLTDTPLAAARRNARRTALLLLGLGDTRPEIEHALGTAGFNPAVAREAAVWAWEELNIAPERIVKMA